MVDRMINVIEHATMGSIFIVYIDLLETYFAITVHIHL